MTDTNSCFIFFRLEDAKVRSFFVNIAFFCNFVGKYIITRNVKMLQKILIMLIIFFTMISDRSKDIVQKPSGDGYVLVFSDEFNLKNGSQPDSSKWVRCIRYNAGWNRWISKSEEVVFIKNGQLVCRAIPNRDIASDTAKMLTGAIETRGKYSFQYGKVEVRMKTNNKRGNFPAAWMKPDIIDPNKYGEIDIMETFGDQGLVHQTIHNHLTTILKKGKPFSAQTKVRLNKWHVYGVEWTPEMLIFTIDGRVTKVFLKSKDKAELADGQWTFDRPFYLLLNQSVGETRINVFLTPDTNHVYETRFDWIRVYQKKR